MAHPGPELVCETALQTLKLIYLREARRDCFPPKSRATKETPRPVRHCLFSLEHSRSCRLFPQPGVPQTLAHFSRLKTRHTSTDPSFF